MRRKAGQEISPSIKGRGGWGLGALAAASRARPGALGLAQLIPSTAAAVAAPLGLAPPTPSTLLVPWSNLAIGARYLADQLAHFDRIEVALAAYNAGPGNAARWLAEGPDLPTFMEAITFGETRAYVEGVLALHLHYEAAYPAN